MASTMATTITLYEVTEQFAVLDAWIHEHEDEILANGGALTPALEALMAQLEGDLATKLERVAMKVKELEASAAAADVEAKRLAQRSKTWGNAAKSLKTYAQRCLEAAGQTSVKTPRFTVRIQANPPALRHPYTPEQLLAIADGEGPIVSAAIISRITVTRSASLDSRGLLAAVKARAEELRAEGSLPEAIEEILAVEFPGCTVEQGSHLRIQ